jgi:hypothetical protein
MMRRLAAILVTVAASLSLAITLGALAFSWAGCGEGGQCGIRGGWWVLLGLTAALFVLAGALLHRGD